MTRFKIGDPIWNDQTNCYVVVYYDIDTSSYDVVHLYEQHSDDSLSEIDCDNCRHEAVWVQDEPCKSCYSWSKWEMP